MRDFVFSEPVSQTIRAILLALLLFAMVKVTGVPQMMAPFGATCALLALAPKAPFSRPVAIVGSHLLTLACGFACAQLSSLINVDPTTIAVLAVLLSIITMGLFKVVHAPAVAHSVIAVVLHPNPQIYATAVLLTCAAFAIFSAAHARLTTEGKARST